MATCRCMAGVSNDRNAESRPDNRSIQEGCHQEFAGAVGCPTY
jgi:hypothetical protein